MGLVIIPVLVVVIILFAVYRFAYSEDDNRALIDKCTAALAPGGRLVAQEIVIHPGRTHPPPGALFAVNMALYTECGDVHTAPTIADWLTRAGLQDVQRRHLPGINEAMLVTGRRPA